MSTPWPPRDPPTPPRKPWPMPPYQDAPEGPTRKDRELVDLYGKLRWAGEDFEQWLGALEVNSEDFSVKDLKRLDKAMTLLKVAFKMLKRLMSQRARRRAKTKELVE